MAEAVVETAVDLLLDRPLDSPLDRSLDNEVEKAVEEEVEKVAEEAKHVEVTMERFPENKEEADIAEAAALAQFSNLSLDERDTILFDIHGVAPTVEEDLDFVATKLEDFVKELCLIEEKDALEQARKWNKNYVDDNDFRLWFLRCSRFDPKKAAELMVTHFEVKKELFGDGKILGREVFLADLSKEDMEALKMGFFQVLPSRDVSGRSITCVSTDWDEKCSVDSVGRAMWYYTMQTQKDGETQQKGTVLVVYNYGDFKHGPEYNARMRRVMVGLPLKIVGAHYCYRHDSVKPFVAGIRRLFLDTESWFHLIKHVGEPDEVAFELQTFGIKTIESPIQTDGSWDLKCHFNWLEMQRTKEEKASAQNEIIVPHRFDVLFGRSTYNREHTGNNRLAHLSEMYALDYEVANKPKKTEITKKLVGIIHESGGRFLKWDGDNGWVVVEDNLAREKIAHMFRNMRMKNNKQEKIAKSRSTKRSSSS